MARVAVLGAGSWGTALGNHLRRAGHEVVLWGQELDVLRAISERSENPKYFPGQKLASGLETGSELSEVVKGADAVVISVPSSAVRSVAEKLKTVLDGSPLIVSTAKGLEDDSLKTMSVVLTEALGSDDKIAVLTGPSFALEVMQGLPTAVTVSSHNEQTREEVAKLFHHGNFRVYTLADVVGAELGGVFKNVIAIAAGVGDTANMGLNGRAALITRGLAEMERLVVALGGESSTVAGLSGLGDLFLTATGDLSRNRRVGMGLGRGEKLEEILDGLGQVAEGVMTTPKILALARQNNVSVPITEEIDRLLRGESNVKESLAALLSRSRRSERKQEN
ncbi:MAG: NAD(P)-dependent glycerol-3-phosphate dehydrogenase [Bdellovibrionales bacterium]|nr:NAD(P)-dependent glycerol-3-phosphate dehydrogenase [Bdellovibrionales bacterium]